MAAAESKLVNVVLNQETRVSTVTLQSPPVNGLTLELLEQLNEILDSLEESGSAGMIITSEMPTIFSAGLDIMEMVKPKPERAEKFWTTFQDTFLKLYGSSFPTVAAINGHSPAGGCILALCCEYRVMVGPKNTIGLNETQLGIVAPLWVIGLMRNTVGQRQTEHALIAGRMFDAETALRIGLVDEVATDKADAVAKAERYIAGMAKIPPGARSLTKKSVRKSALEEFVKNKEKDLQSFLSFINKPAIQQGLETYLKMLKLKTK